MFKETIEDDEKCFYRKDFPSKVTKIPEGGISEFAEWEIHENYIVSHYDDTCRHCHSGHIHVKTRSDKSTYDHNISICPRVVIVQNEGGYSGTVVCLDCVIEASK